MSDMSLKQIMKPFASLIVFVKESLWDYRRAFQLQKTCRAESHCLAKRPARNAIASRAGTPFLARVNLIIRKEPPSVRGERATGNKLVFFREEDLLPELRRLQFSTVHTFVCSHAVFCSLTARGRMPKKYLDKEEGKPYRLQ